MKRTIILLILVLIVALSVPAFAGKGNEAPSGGHYNLNIIGVPNGVGVPGGKDAGHVIFVPLEENCRIVLTEGPFKVLDKNCTDDNFAAFQLPDPDEDDNGVTEYSVYGRVRSDSGWVNVTTCMKDNETGDTYCETHNNLLVRSKSNNFKNVTRELLTVEIEGVRRALFWDRFESAWWDWWQNCRLAQLRFYEVPYAY